MNNKAFTLIELLVVVLIIGILASIALPQYQVAVAKSRAMPMVSVMRSIDSAQQVFKLANNEYSTDLGALDVQLATTEDNNYRYWQLISDAKAKSLYAEEKRSGVRIEKYYDRSSFICWADPNNSQYDLQTKICKSIAGGAAPTETADDGQSQNGYVFQ